MIVVVVDFGSVGEAVASAQARRSPARPRGPAGPVHEVSRSQAAIGRRSSDTSPPAGSEPAGPRAPRRRQARHHRRYGRGLLVVTSSLFRGQSLLASWMI